MKRTQNYRLVEFVCAQCRKKVKRRRARVHPKMYCSHNCKSLHSYHAVFVTREWRAKQKQLLKGSTK